MKRSNVLLIVFLTLGIPLLGFSYAQGQDEKKTSPPRKKVERQTGEARKGSVEADRARLLERLEKSGRLPKDPAERRALLRRLQQQRGGQQQQQGQAGRERLQRQRGQQQQGQAGRERLQRQRGQQQQGQAGRQRLQQRRGQMDPQRMKAILERITKNHPEAARMLRQRFQQRKSGDPVRDSVRNPVRNPVRDPVRRPDAARKQVQPPLRAKKAPQAGSAVPGNRKNDPALRIKALEKQIQALKKKLNEAKKASTPDRAKGAEKS